jgi:hypothetical protein
MKPFVYAFLLLCLPACRLSQSLPLVDTSESTVDINTAAAAPAAVIVFVGAKPIDSTSHKQASTHQVNTQQRRQSQVVRLVRSTHSIGARKIYRAATTRSFSTATDKPNISPTGSFIIAGLGIILSVAMLLVIPSISTIGGAIGVGFAFALGVALVLSGLFSYLLRLYEKGRATRAAKPKR